MTLRQATADALAAAEAGNLERLGRALEARAQAIARGEAPDDVVIGEGRRIADLLRSLIRQTILESARLRQIQAGFVGQRAENVLDLAG